MTLRYVYVREHGDDLPSLALHQSPADSRFFELGQVVGRRVAGTTDPPELLRPEELRAIDGKPRTDLASVPPFLWSLTATYGRQTLPALFHDRDADAAYALAKTKPADGWEDRRQADDEFYAGLRSNRVPVARSWIMWAAVRGQAYWAHHHRGALSGMILHLLAIVAVWALTIVLWVNPALARSMGLGALRGWLPIVMVLLAIIAPLTVSFWKREAALAYTLLFVLVVMGVPVLVSLVVYLYFRLIDAIAKPFDKQKGPILWPTYDVEAQLAEARAAEVSAQPAVIAAT